MANNTKPQTPTPQNNSRPANPTGNVAAQGTTAAPVNKIHSNSSLYVGELNDDITEGALFELFNQVGPVASIRVCRDNMTRRSLGYAYVNFHSVVDAERALDTLNNTPIKGRPCRIMWSQRDPAVRKSGVGNIFIKNLDPAIGHKELHDTFSEFGNILSCKVATDDRGNSLGYGFVHFDTVDSADSAIQMVNGMRIGEKQVYVGHFRQKKDREMEKETSWTNVYIKDLDPSLNDEELKKIFEKYGPVSSAVVMNDKGVSKGFAFVNFENHEDAVKAVADLNGNQVGEKKIWCGRAQKKAERESELKKKHEQIKMDRLTKYQGINLYIKNLEDEVNEERLRKEFSAFGEIKSIKIMADEKGTSKGFGFICFSTPEEAQRAITEMNGRVLQGCTKPLYVALHEPKEMRRHKLAARAAAAAGRGAKPRPGALPSGPVPQLYAAGGQPVYYPPGATPQGFVYPQQMIPPRGGQRGWAQQPFPQMPNFIMQMPRGGAPAGAQVAPIVADGSAQVAAPAGAQGNAQQRGRNPNPRGAGRGNNGRAPQELTLQYITTLPAEKQKAFIGEKLYRLIERSHPQQAGKITGMFLDSRWTIEELFSLTQNEAKLNSKILEGIEVLRQSGHHTEESQ